MLPGFRFLLAAIVLSISILVFGLGAAALLRAAHEEVASNPGWHAAPDATFAQQTEVARPVLAMLRVDPPPAQPKAPDDVAAVASPAEPVAAPAPTEQVTEVPLVPAEQTAMVSAAVESEKVAAQKPEETSQPVAAKPEFAATESPAAGEAANIDAVANHTRIASAGQGLPPAIDASSVPSELPPATTSTQTAAQVSPQASIPPTKIAALADPATEPQPRASTDNATPDRSIIRKRQQARRAAQRRRMALLRARQARLALLQQQQSGDLFSQPQPLLQPPVAVRQR